MVTDFESEALGRTFDTLVFTNTIAVWHLVVLAFFIGCVNAVDVPALSKRKVPLMVAGTANSPSVAEQALTLFAVNNGYFDDIDVKKALAAERAMRDYIKGKYGDLVDRIARDMGPVQGRVFNVGGGMANTVSLRTWSREPSNDQRRAFERLVREQLLAGGDPAKEIAEAAAREGCDLIAMSTHGRTGVKRWLMGSVADKIIHHAHIPVMLIHPN